MSKGIKKLKYYNPFDIKKNDKITIRETKIKSLLSKIGNTLTRFKGTNHNGK